MHNSFSPRDNLVHKVDVLSCQGGKRMGRPSFFPPPKKQRLHVYSWQGNVGCVFRRRLTICTTVYPHLITFWTRLMFNHVREWKERASPVFPHPLTSNLMFYAYSGQGNLRLAEFFPTQLTLCTTVFPHVIYLCIRLMFNLVRVGKEWAGPVFPQPLKSKGYTCIHDRVRLAVFFCRGLTYAQHFPPPNKLLNKVDVKPCQGGERMGRPSFSPPHNKQL